MNHLLFALNVELSAAAPEWVQLIPAGPHIVGRDGREWKFDLNDLAHVLNNFDFGGVDIPIDYEHSTELKGPNGEEAPAAGWIKELEDRDGSLWGRVEWTERARNQIGGREYRFLSPVFSFTKTDRAIRVLDSAGLTNKPNLRLTALNRRAANMEDDTMKKALCRLLGLDPETATEQQIQDAVAKLKGDLATAANRGLPTGLLSALGLGDDADEAMAIAKAKDMAAGDGRAANSAQGDVVDLSRYVPRADYDLALNRATTAEAAIKDRDAAELDGKIEAAVNRAIKDGKIAPASREFYVASCRTEGGLEQFQKFAESAPQVIADPQLPENPDDNGKALNTQQAAIAAQFGNTAEDLAKYAGKED
jgi:phage I-like protein